MRTNRHSKQSLVRFGVEEPERGWVQTRKNQSQTNKKLLLLLLLCLCLWKTAKVLLVGFGSKKEKAAHRKHARKRVQTHAIRPNNTQIWLKLRTSPRGSCQVFGPWISLWCCRLYHIGPVEPCSVMFFSRFSGCGKMSHFALLVCVRFFVCCLFGFGFGFGGPFHISINQDNSQFACLPCFVAETDRQTETVRQRQRIKKAASRGNERALPGGACASGTLAHRDQGRHYL